MEGAISQRFTNLNKDRAAPSRLMYAKILPLGSTTARAGEIIRISLPANRSATSIDWNASYLRVDIKPSKKVILSEDAGFMGIFSSVTLRNSGSVLHQITNHGPYRSLFGQLLYSEDVLKKDFSIMSGTGRRILEAGETTTLCEPMCNLGGITSLNKYITMNTADSLTFDLQLGNATYGVSTVIATNATLTASVQELADGLANATSMNTSVDGLVLSNIEFVCAFIETSPSVEKSILQAHGGIYKYLSQNVASFMSNVPAGVFIHNFSVGCSFSSANCIYIAFREIKTAEFHQNSDFIKAELKNVTLYIDGQAMVLSGGIDVSKSSIVKAHQRIAGHHLSDGTIPGINMQATYDTESFIICFDLETIQERSNTLRSGFDLSSTTTNLEVTFGTMTSKALLMDVFVSYDCMVSCDMTTNRNWEISI